MVDTVSKKPANRPSRRQDLVSAAVELFSLQAWELVTIADIVERADMTLAAFYYHFSSREELLDEIIRSFAARWTTETERLFDEAESLEALCAVPELLVDFVSTSESEAKVFFLSSATAPLLVEQIRRDARNQLIRAATRAVRRLAEDRPRAELMVNGVSVVVVCEVAVRTQLGLDDAYRTLGPRRYREAINRLCQVAAGYPEEQLPA